MGTHFYRGVEELSGPEWWSKNGRFEFEISDIERLLVTESRDGHGFRWLNQSKAGSRWWCSGNSTRLLWKGPEFAS